MTAVLLSASIPGADERGAAVRPFHPGDITAAASSAIEAVLRSGAELVFGGHPTITPIVLEVASLLAAGPRVHIWQSDFFIDEITPEVWRLIDEERANLHRVRRCEDRSSSLAAMRDEMLVGHHFAAAMFVGGMEGIATELDLLESRAPTVPFFLFVTPGGMAARVASEWRLPTDRLLTIGHIRGRALVGRAYGSLAMSALSEIGLKIGRRGEL